MSGKSKKKDCEKTPLTPTQLHIKELRASLNAPDPNEIRPFTWYKILTYLCVVAVPLVPVALYRIWCLKTEFTKKEQIIWTSVIGTIAVYALKTTFF